MSYKKGFVLQKLSMGGITVFRGNAELINPNLLASDEPLMRGLGHTYYFVYAAESNRLTRRAFDLLGLPGTQMPFQYPIQLSDLKEVVPQNETARYDEATKQVLWVAEICS